MPLCNQRHASTLPQPYLLKSCTQQVEYRVIFMCLLMGKRAKGGLDWDGVGGPLFMDVFYLLGARYQLGHCLVSCSSCNIYFIYINFISSYFTYLFYPTYFIFTCKYNINMQRT